MVTKRIIDSKRLRKGFDCVLGCKWRDVCVFPEKKRKTANDVRNTERFLFGMSYDVPAFKVLAFAHIPTNILLTIILFFIDPILA